MVIVRLASQNCNYWLLYPCKIIDSIINFRIFFCFLIINHLCSWGWTHVGLNILYLAYWAVLKIILLICPHHALLAIALTISFIISFAFILSWILGNLCLTFLGRSVTQSRTSIANLRIHVGCLVTIFFIYWGHLGSFLAQQFGTHTLIII